MNDFRLRVTTFGSRRNPLPKVQPPADRSRAQMKMVLTHRAQRGKNAEAFLKNEHFRFREESVM